VPRVFVTTSDGETTTEMPRAEFQSAVHTEPILTISADWLVDGVMDGYVLATCEQKAGLAVEHYQYGALDALESTFIDLLFARFESLARENHRALLAIDAEGASSEEEWLRVYENAAAVPPTAAVLAVSTGRFEVRAPRLEKSFDGEGIEIYAPARQPAQ
jgi:hypothetical protein